MNPNTQKNTLQPDQQPVQGPSRFAGDQSPSRSTSILVSVHPSPSWTQRRAAEDIINMAFSNIPNATLRVLKRDLGLDGKDISALTSNDKERILFALRARGPSIPLDDGVCFSGDVLGPTLMFRADEDINFERDFGQWFHPEGSLDLK